MSTVQLSGVANDAQQLIDRLFLGNKMAGYLLELGEHVRQVELLEGIADVFVDLHEALVGVLKALEVNEEDGWQFPQVDLLARVDFFLAVFAIPLVLSS